MPAIDWAPFSPKCLDAAAHCDAFVNILEGAVRSSKTVAANIAFIDLLQQSPHSEFLITGQTQDTIVRNLLQGQTGLLNILGKRRAVYLGAAQGGAQLRVQWPGRPAQICYCIGAHNKDAEGRVRGLTSGGWLADEITLYPEEFVKQSLNRLSLPGARAIWTMNPDSPFGYLFTEFIGAAAEKGYRHWHFELDDNWSLTPEYKASIRAAYAGLWYKRMVLGQWVAAEGAIYDMLDAELHVVGRPQCPVAALPPMRKYWVGVDYGTASVTCFWLLGLGDDQRLYFCDRWRWDVAKTMVQKTDLEFAVALEAWLAGLNVSPEYVFVPEDAASFIAQLQRSKAAGQLSHVGALAVADRSPGSVLRRLRNISTLLKLRRLLFAPAVYAQGGLNEWAGYTWDPKAQREGRDEPVKVNDHDPDAGGYAITGARPVWSSWITEAA